MNPIQELWNMALWPWYLAAATWRNALDAVTQPLATCSERKENKVG